MKKYQIELTEYQVKILSKACDVYSRLICGQDLELTNLMEEAWERRAKKETGNFMDKEFEGGWYKAREKAEEIAAEMKRIFWNTGRGQHYGIHYDDTADILWDIHQVLRHQLYLDKPKAEREQLRWTVLADTPMHVGKEPLITIKPLC